MNDSKEKNTGGGLNLKTKIKLKSIFSSHNYASKICTVINTSNKLSNVDR